MLISRSSMPNLQKRHSDFKTPVYISRSISILNKIFHPCMYIYSRGITNDTYSSDTYELDWYDLGFVHFSKWVELAWCFLTLATWSFMKLLKTLRIVIYICTSDHWTHSLRFYYIELSKILLYLLICGVSLYGAIRIFINL
ncbi:Schizosaccharomyces pombe specific protein [Schizosaccharomyces pombe]|uniref:Uncharacterized protein C1271.08c n=1 Tax=Schizosaccharomyces pombe (strain 972 / ATCC 24843) TaxID=284812 RepID=YHM8_SCHPO|nr:uncharacterized protein SPBC1271.08c [Schizosaccharomyces pombe]O94341.1 RecName: Full=Uncharacterized protein C1271.08c [Schizosaccharomyces pombe 972h-]CAA22198.1 sequence orphan [Schizosaccharomyces pombe]|eukprot:NP_595142.1 uncharacterized protein SPBC1271.08c [Schizosaccharomyces pombe]